MRSTVSRSIGSHEIKLSRWSLTSKVLLCALCVSSFLFMKTSFPDTYYAITGYASDTFQGATSVQRSVVNQSIIVYRVYLVEVGLNKTRISIVALKRCDNANRSLVIQLMIPNQYNTTTTSLKPAVIDGYTCISRWAPGCKWNGFLYEQTVSVDVKAVTGAKLGTTQNESFVDVSDDKLIKNSIVSLNYTYDMANCIQPMFLYADWMQLVQFIEIWRSFGGSQHFFVYTTQLTKFVDDLLSAYEIEGIVTKIPWPLFPNGSTENPNLSTYRLNHQAAITDCLLRTAGIVKYVALVDLDEFFLPNHPYRTTYDALDKAFTSRPRMGSLTISKNNKMELITPYPQGLVDVSQASLFDHLSVVRLSGRGGGPGKVFARPERAGIALTHSTRGDRAPYRNYVKHHITEASLYHLRRFATHPLAKVYTNFTVFKATGPQIQMNFWRLLQKHFNQSAVQNGSNTLVETFSTTIHAFSKCMQRWRSIGRSCKIALACWDKVPAEKRNTTEWVLHRQSVNYSRIVI